jgi:hypothetical protein
MKPSTSSTAIGSLKPDSPSSVVARRRLSVEVRRSAKIAAPSVAARTEPSSRPSRVERSKSQTAANPVTAAVTIVPTIARLIAGASTGRISSSPEVSPPSKRISASAMIPMRRASV